MVWYEYERMVLGTVIWYDRDVHVPVSGTKKQDKNAINSIDLFFFSKSILFFLLVGF